MAYWLLLQLLINGVVAGSLYALLAVSFAVIYVPTRTFHFAHASIYVYAGYFLYQIAVGWGWPLATAILGGVLGAGAMGVLVDRLVYTPLRRRGSGVMEVLLSAFATFVVLQAVILLVWKSDPRTVGIAEVWKRGISFGLLTVTPLDLLTVASSAVILAGVALFMRTSRLGKAIRAVESDPGMAAMVGIPTERVRAAAFFLGSALVAVAAAFHVLDKALEPTIGVNALLVAVVAMIVGGVGSFPGAALAGLLLGIVENLGIWKLPSEWKTTITFSVLALFLLFRPTGFFGQRVTRYSE